MCAPCLHVFVKRTGSEPLPYRFYWECQCSSCEFFCKVCCVLVVEMFFSFFFFCPFVLLSARTNHFIIIEILISCFFYGPKKIFMAMNKHWQLCSYFPFVFISCKYFVANVCNIESFRELKAEVWPLYIYTKTTGEWFLAKRCDYTYVNNSVAARCWLNIPQFFIRILK